MNIELAPENCGLVIVDMQAEGCERHGPTLKPVVKNIRHLLDRFRAANGKIIHVQSVRTKDHPEFTVFGKEYSLIDGTPAVEFIEELKPLPGEIIVQKFSHDCFYQTTMEDTLKTLDLRSCRDRIIVTGIGTNNCVYHAVIGFHIFRHRPGRLHPRQPSRRANFRPGPVSLAGLQLQHHGSQFVGDWTFGAGQKGRGRLRD
jgi:isochorismate hydrolase